MKKKILFFVLFALIFTNQISAQYVFPDCYTAYDPNKSNYTGGEKASLNGSNYTAKYWINSPPPGVGWTKDGPCGDAYSKIGQKYSGEKKVIGYMPTWQSDYDFNDYDASKITHVIVSFLDFKAVDIGVVHENMDYNSNDFVREIKFSEESLKSVDSILKHSTTNLLEKSRLANTKVMAAIGGAIDYGFLWLMEKYYNDDAKITEIAKLMINYVESREIDGVDLDMECWWADPSIKKTTDQGGRYRGTNSVGDGKDDGPENAAIGITRLAKKLKQLKPSMIVSSVVFGTGWYGNNYDEEMADYMDWIGIFTYDFTGSWATTPFGPHGALKKLPLDSYTHQTADNPIFSTEEVCEFWVGIAEPTWNHDGGFDIEVNKLCIGAPFYGYDFSTPKPNGGNGYEFERYKDIVAKYPDAPISYDSKSLGGYNGNINESGENIFYETPERAKAKIDFIYDYGQQGIIIWELTNDLEPSHQHSLLNALNTQKQYRESPLSVNDNIVSKPSTIINFYNNKIYYKKETNLTSKENLEVYNILGQKVASYKIENKEEAFSVNLNEGIYIIKLKEITKKILVTEF